MLILCKYETSIEWNNILEIVTVKSCWFGCENFEKGKFANELVYVSFNPRQTYKTIQ